MIKRLFFTGLAVLLPAVITILIANFFLNLFTRPFQNFVENIFNHYHLVAKPFLFLTASQVLALLSKILVILLLLIITFLTGFFAQIVFTNYFIRLGDKVLHKIPIVNKIYKITQDAVKVLFSDKKQAFSQVVLVPFPHKKAYGIAFITQQEKKEEKKNGEEEEDPLISVFLPAAPNPTAGFILMFKKSQLIFTNMKVDDAFKTVLSCGMVFSKEPPKESPKELLKALLKKP